MKVKSYTAGRVCLLPADFKGCYTCRANQYPFY